MPQVLSLCVLPDGLVVSGCDGGRLRTWQWDPHAPVRLVPVHSSATLPRHSSGPRCLVALPQQPGGGGSGGSGGGGASLWAVMHGGQSVKRWDAVRVVADQAAAAEAEAPRELSIEALLFPSAPEGMAYICGCISGGVCVSGPVGIALLS